MTSRGILARDRVDREGNFFRKTHVHSGRNVAIAPANSTIRHLSYARTKLNAVPKEANFNTGKSETTLICLGGEAAIGSGAEEFTVAKFDAAWGAQ